MDRRTRWIVRLDGVQPYRMAPLAVIHPEAAVTRTAQQAPLQLCEERVAQFGRGFVTPLLQHR